MINKLKVLIFNSLILFVSCKQLNKDKTEYNQNSISVQNLEELQKNNFTVSDITNENCNCAENDFAGTKTDTIYKLSNGKKIALCGYRNIENKPINFSEFVLSVCNEKKIIDFWGTTETCNLRTTKDTLIIEELINLPTEKNRIYKPTIWSIEKIYFNNEKLKRNKILNQKIRKYNNEEISATLKEYENADEKINDEKMQLVNRLFIATISNDKKARKYFYEFEMKYELDGAFSEEYSDLKEMLEVWDKQK